MYFVVNLREKARNQERGVRGGRRERGSEEGVKAVHVALRAGLSLALLHYSALHSTQRRRRRREGKGSKHNQIASRREGGGLGRGG